MPPGVPYCLVVGSPVAHSLSPVLHRAAYAHLGLAWGYEAHEITAGGLGSFVADRDDLLRGLSVTMPLKDEAAALGRPSSTVLRTGAANTLVFDGDDIGAHNTDVPGLVAALHEHGVTAAESAVVVGTGATARSSVVAAHELGVRRLTILGRTPAHRESLASFAEHVGLAVAAGPLDEPVGTHDLVFSSIPAAAQEPMAGRLAAAAGVVFDVVYDPWPTPLARHALALGRSTLNGLDLLVHQAVVQVRLFTGRDVPASVLASAGQEALSARARA